MTPIRRGAARRLGIRRPDGPPGSVLTWQGRLTDTEAEEIRARFTAAMGAISVHNLRPINLQGSQLSPDRCHGVPLCHLPAGHDGPHRWKAADGTEMIMGWAIPTPDHWRDPDTPPDWVQPDLRAFKQERLASWPTPERCHGVPQCQLADGHDGPHRWKAGNGDQMIMWPL